MIYYKQLDALRCYSVFWVIMSHLAVNLLPSKVWLFLSYIEGVPIFFCISGFLITNIVLKNNDGESGQFFKSFYARRFLRIFPIYYLTIIFLGLLNPENYRDTWLYYDFLYISNIKIGMLGSFNSNLITPHFWSLAVEEQFYLIWPATLYFASKKNRGYVPGIIFLAVGILSTFCFGSFFVSRTFGAVSYLGSGCIIALLFHHTPEAMSRFRKTVHLLFALILVALLGASYMNYQASGATSQLISIMVVPLLLLKFVYGFRSRLSRYIVENNIVRYLGKISYGLYVYHMLAIYPLVVLEKLLGPALFSNDAVAALCKAVITIVVAIVSWELLEKKINNRKLSYSYK